ncbi:MAG: hypothetical protein C3F11_20840 [Methylocystaceae bacterium]|nr:MAG: hypothetical protein C3F11_20840 [Methylocystaceae bacterium]
MPAPIFAKEKSAAGEDQPEKKTGKKTSADTKKTGDGKKTAEAGKPNKDEKSAGGKEARTAKDKEPKNGQDGKNGKDKNDRDKSGGKGPVPVGTYGDWSALTAHGQGKDKTCYALAEPKDRQPAKLSRDKAYVFISTRPSEGVRNEVAVIMGFPLKDGGSASADIDGDNFELVTKGTNAWVKNPAKEREFVEALKSGAKLVVKAPSVRGNVTADTYSLKGLSEALARVQKECQ